jgi:transposase
VRELVADRPRLLAVVEPVLRVRGPLISEYQVLYQTVLDTVRDDPGRRRRTTVPGVGAVVALTYRATVDQPARFARSKSVGASFGLTPQTYQSGKTDRTGRISEACDALTRAALYEAGHAMLTRVTKGGT